MSITRGVQFLVGLVWRLLVGRVWRPGTSREPPSAITELSRALAEGRPGGLQLFEKLTGNEQLWWRCCRDAVQTQPSWLQYPDHDKALGLIRDTELVASRGAVSRAVEAVDLICQALVLPAGPASPAAQVSGLVAQAAACWDDSPAALAAGAANFTPQTAAASAVPYLRDHVTNVLACLGNVSTDGRQAMAAICALLLAADRPDTGRVVRVPVVLARPSEKHASSGGVAGTLELREFPPGPSGLFPDPRGLRNRRADSAFDAGLRLAWQFATDTGGGGRCVLWRLSLDAGVPDYAIDGGSLGAAFAIALRELLRRPRGSRPAPLAAPRAFFIGLRPKCAITGVLAAQRPPAYDQLTSRTANGPWLDEVGGMDAKLEAASAKSLRLVAPAANRPAAQPRAAMPVDWAETIHQADRYARRVRPIRTAITSAGLVLAALAVGLAVLTTVAIGQRSTIISERGVAASNALVDQSEATGASDPVLARLEAVAAWRLDPSPRAGNAMLSAAAIPWTAALTSHTANQEDSAAFSPGGTLLAAATEDGTQLWNITTRKLVTTLPAGTGLSVDSVVFSPSGTLLAAGTAGGIQIWNITTRKLVTTLSAGTTDPVMAVAFSLGGTLLAAGMTNPGGGTQLWDVATRKLVATFPDGTGNTVFAVAFSPDGRLLATGADNPNNPFRVAKGINGTQLWDVATHKLAATLHVGIGNSDAVAFSRDGTLLAAGTENGTQLWNLPRRKLVTTLPGSPAHPVNSVAFSPDGTLLADDTVDGTQVWDVATRKLVTTLPPSTGNSVNSVAFSPDGTLLAVGTNHGTWLADLADGVMPSSPSTLPASTVSNADAMAFSPDGTLLAADTSDGTIHLWDVATRKLITALPPSTGNSPGGGNSVTFSPDGRLLAAITYHQPDYWGIQLWDVATRKLVTTLRPAGFNAVDAVAFSPDGKLLAAGVSEGTEFWDVAMRKLVTTLPSTGQFIDGVAFSPDGSLLAAGTIGPTQLWDVATRKLIAMLPTDTTWTDLVAFSPDGSLLAVGTNNGTQLWDVATRKLATTLPTGFSIGANSVSFSPDGTVLAICNGTIVELWDVKTIRQVGSLSPGDAEFATFNRNGTLLAVIAYRKPIQLLAPYPRNTVSYLCRLAGESFPPDEWAKYAPGVPYMKTCP